MFKVRLENIKVKEDITNDKILEKACDQFKIDKKYVTDYKIVKKSIDARDKNDIFYNYSILITLNEDYKISRLSKNKNAKEAEIENYFSFI